jgi:fatty-acyl-CoA synthase
MATRATSGVTYGEVIVEALGRYPERDAFVLGDRRVTYAEAASTTSRIRQVFVRKGLARGRAVAALSPNVPEVWLCQAAAYLTGACYTGLHPLGSVDDHVAVCDDAEIDVLVVHPTFAETGAEIAERAPSVRYLLTLGPAPAGVNLLALCENVAERPLDAGPADEEDIAWLQYTGGTTGRPKGVMLSQRAMAQEVQSLTASWGLPETPRYLVASPITHAGVLPVLPVLARGGTVVLHRSFDPEMWLRTVRDEHVNYALAVPTMLYALLDHGAAGRCESLETVVYGAAPMSPARVAEAMDALGPVLHQVYGQTECAGMATSLRKDEHSFPELLTSCGRAVAGTRVEVLGEDGARLPAGEVGEVCVRSRAVMCGYWNQPELTRETLHGGWLHTGDLAVRDEAGFFHIVDRKKDMIVTGGFNVYPREVEDVLATDPAVSAVAVIGVPDDHWGEAVIAFVVPRPGEPVDAARLVELVRTRKGPHQAPKHVETVDALPVTNVGKIDKKALRARYWSGEDRNVH